MGKKKNDETELDDIIVNEVTEELKIDGKGKEDKEPSWKYWEDKNI